ncbi:MAG: dinitrogenase iron-molybdenum cofactor biosynthesis protein [Anaerolineae bacterium]|nr:dinitrogenase iron-molybdenum cofactor biosynthesis protein [Anaerolineae bacterium]
MKVAVITDNGQTISQHFGRAAYYLVFTVEDGEITDKELRDKIGHQQFAQEDHDHDSEHDPRGHGFGAQSDAKHVRMIESIQDCDAIIVRGMGRGAYIAMEQANIRPFVTELADPEQAVRAWISGTLDDRTEKLH